MTTHLCLIAALLLITLAGQSHAHEEQHEAILELSNALADRLKNDKDLLNRVFDMSLAHQVRLDKLDLQTSILQTILDNTYHQYPHTNDTDSCNSRDFVETLIHEIELRSLKADELTEKYIPEAEYIKKGSATPRELHSIQLDIFRKFLNVDVCEED